MFRQDSSAPRIFSSLIAALALLGALMLAPAASADTIGQVSVSATVASSLSFTLCDTNANFGTGLTSTGAAPTGTTDAIGVTTLSSQTGGSVYYHWTPSCQVPGNSGTQARFFRVESTSSWRLTPCAAPDNDPGASPTLKIVNSDLRWAANISTPFVNYANANAASAFVACDANNPTSLLGASGTLDIYGHYYLQIEPTDQPGGFNVTTQWTLTPA
jgi:hypothetical protein